MKKLLWTVVLCSAMLHQVSMMGMEKRILSKAKKLIPRIIPASEIIPPPVSIPKTTPLPQPKSHRVDAQPIAEKAASSYKTTITKATALRFANFGKIKGVAVPKALQGGSGYTAGTLGKSDQQPDKNKAIIQEILDAINRLKPSENFSRYVDEKGYFVEASADLNGKERILYFYRDENGNFVPRQRTWREWLLGRDNRVKVDPAEFYRAQVASLPIIERYDENRPTQSNSANSGGREKKNNAVGTRSYSTQVDRNTWSEQDIRKQLQEAWDTSPEAFKNTLRELRKKLHPDSVQGEKNKQQAHIFFVAIDNIAQDVINKSNKTQGTKAEKPHDEKKQPKNGDEITIKDMQEELHATVQHNWLRDRIHEDEQQFNAKNDNSFRCYDFNNSKYYQGDIDPKDGKAIIYELEYKDKIFKKSKTDASQRVKDLIEETWLKKEIEKDQSKLRENGKIRYRSFWVPGYYELERDENGTIIKVRRLILEEGRFVPKESEIPLEVYQNIAFLYNLDPSLPGSKKKTQNDREAEKMYWNAAHDFFKFNEENPSTTFRKDYDIDGKRHFLQVEINPANGTLKKITEFAYSNEDGAFVKIKGRASEKLKKEVYKKWYHDQTYDDEKIFNEENTYKKRDNVYNMSTGNFEYKQVNVKSKDGSFDGFFKVEYEKGKWIPVEYQLKKLSDKEIDELNYQKNSMYHRLMVNIMDKDKRKFNKLNKDVLRVVIEPRRKMPQYYQAHMRDGDIDAIYHLRLQDEEWIPESQQIAGDEKQEVIKALAK